MTISELAYQASVVANPPRPPAPSGAATGAMLAQYGRKKRKLNKIWDEGGHGYLTTS